MTKIQRKYMAHYINTAWNSQNGSYERLGQDLEEFSAEMSAQVQTKKNILGETSVMISGYEKTAAVETFYAQQESDLFQCLQEIIDGNLVLDDLKTDIVEVKLWESDIDGGPKDYMAVKETVYIEVTSYGGDTTGYQIPFTIHYTGEKVNGSFNIETKTFTAA